MMKNDIFGGILSVVRRKGGKCSRIMAIALIFSIVSSMLPLGSAPLVSAADLTQTADFATSYSTALSLLGAGASWNNFTKTLTLNNVHITSTADRALVLPGGSTIILQGANSISGTGPGTPYLSNIRIYSTGSLTFTGAGSLTIESGDQYGINAEGGITLLETVNISVSMTPVRTELTSAGLLANSGPILVKDQAHVTSDGADNAYWCTELAVYDQAQLYGHGNLYGVNNYLSRRSNGSIIEISGDTAASEEGYYHAGGAPRPAVNVSTTDVTGATTTYINDLTLIPPAEVKAYKYIRFNIMETNQLGTLSAPPAIDSYATLSPVAPTISGLPTPYETGWEYSANGSSSWTKFDPAVKTFTRLQNNHYIRYYTTNGAGTAYSNSVQISVNKFKTYLTITPRVPYTREWSLDNTYIDTYMTDGVNKVINKVIAFYNGDEFLANTGNYSTELFAKYLYQGSYSISARFPGDDNYEPSVSNVVPFLVLPALLTQSPVSYASTADIQKTYGDGSFSLPAVSGGSGTGALKYSSSNTNVATVTQEGVVTIVGQGQATLYVYRMGDDTYADSSSASLKVNVAKRPLTISGISALDKTYDRTTTATLDTAAALLEGILPGETVNISYTSAKGTFADKHAGNDKTVTYSGFALSGTHAANYVLSAQPASTTADIFKKTVTVSGITANNKIYDGSPGATLIYPALTTLGFVSGDTVSLSAEGLFSDKDAGASKTVNISGLVISGADAGNYELAETGNQTTATATISQKVLTVLPDTLSKKAGEEDPVLTYGTTYPAIGETATFTGALTRLPGETLGSYPISLGTLALADNGAFKADNYKLELSATPVSFRISLVATASDYIVTGNADAWNKEDLTISPTGDYTEISTDGITWSSSITLSTEGSSSTVDFYLKKGDGSVAEKLTYTYKLDKTAPTATLAVEENQWTSFLNTITFGYFFKENQSITITSSDASGSGVASTGYYVMELSDNTADFDASPAEAALYTYTSGTSFNIQPDKNVIIFVRLEDQAGNVSYLNTQGLVLDGTAPAISGLTDGATYYTTQNITITDTNLDTVTLNSSAFTGSSLQGDVNRTYVLVATDKAGNTTTYTVTMKTIASLAAPIEGLAADNVNAGDEAAIMAVKAAVQGVNTEDATQEEKDKLAAITATCGTLLDKITAVARDISAVLTKLGTLGEANAKSTDRTVLEEVLADLQLLLDSDNLTDNERSVLFGKKAVAEAALDRIDAVAAALSGSEDLGEGITEDNATAEDKTDLESALAEIASILESYDGNLTAAEKSALGGRKAVAEKALARINEIARMIEDATKGIQGITEDNAALEHEGALKEAIAALKDLLQTYPDNLTAIQKLAIGEEIADAEKALLRIEAVVKAVSDGEELIRGITESNATASDRTRLEQAIAEFQRILKDYAANLTESDKLAMAQKIADAKKSLARIDTVAKAVAEAKDLVRGITENNVNKNDRTRLEKAKADLQRILQSYGDNLTLNEKAAIFAIVTLINDNLQVLEEVRAVEGLISALPAPGSVKNTDAAAVRGAEDAYNRLSGHQKSLVSQDAAVRLKDVSEALSRLLQLFDKSSGTRLEGLEGTGFDLRTELVVTKIKDSLNKKTLEKFAVNVRNAAGGQVITQLYDITLLLDGQPIQPDGKVRITLKLTEEQKGYKDLQVVYIADDGSVEIVPCEINGDEVTFVTDHLSYYGIIGTETGSFPWILVVVLAALTLGVGIKIRRDRLSLKRARS